MSRYVTAVSSAGTSESGVAEVGRGTEGATASLSDNLRACARVIASAGAFEVFLSREDGMHVFV